jgi:hypothetical protein
MIIVHHHADCSGNPSPSGRLRGTCDCSVAPRTTEARGQISHLLAQIAQRSISEGEERAYLAIRLELLAEQLTSVASSLRLAVDNPKRGHEQERGDKVRLRIATESGSPPPARSESQTSPVPCGIVANQGNSPTNLRCACGWRNTDPVLDADDALASHVAEARISRSRSST